MAKSYEASGVNLEAGYEVVSRIKKHVASTTRPGCMGGIGAFGGMFDLGSLGYRHPVLVSGTDGVGTKLKIAFLLDKHDTIGIDAVAMCVNDVLAQGAEPLLFLDYVAVGKNRPEVVESIVAGVAEGCRQAGCALVGGETAEMPGMYAPEDYDIAGFTVGAVEKDELIDGSKVAEGDVLVGIPSTGVHSNGFSLVRKIVADADLDLAARYPETGDKTLGETLLTPRYCKYIRKFPYFRKFHSLRKTPHQNFNADPICNPLNDFIKLLIDHRFCAVQCFHFLQCFPKSIFYSITRPQISCNRQDRLFKLIP